MKLSIIGAGVSGLAAAYQLHHTAPSLHVECFEKSRGLGGRSATRRKEGVIFDHGAQFFRTQDAGQLAFFRDTLPAEFLVDIESPVWIHDANGTVSPGDSSQNSLEKLTYIPGMNYLGKLLKPQSLQVHQQQRIHHVAYANHTYTLYDSENQILGQSDALLLTPPGPQTVDIIAASDIDDHIKTIVQAAYAPVVYRPCISFTVCFPVRIQTPFYALVNPDRGHPISWLAVEHAKHPDRVPATQTAVTIQLAPQASRTHWDDSVDQLMEQFLPHIATLLSQQLPDPLWGDRQGWRYALPDGRADLSALQSFEQSHHLYFSGDALVGIGRLHLAIRAGFEVADRIARHHSAN